MTLLFFFIMTRTGEKKLNFFITYRVNDFFQCDHNESKNKLSYV